MGSFNPAFVKKKRQITQNFAANLVSLCNIPATRAMPYSVLARGWQAHPDLRKQGTARDPLLGALYESVAELPGEGVAVAGAESRANAVPVAAAAPTAAPAPMPVPVPAAMPAAMMAVPMPVATVPMPMSAVTMAAVPVPDQSKGANWIGLQSPGILKDGSGQSQLRIQRQTESSDAGNNQMRFFHE